VTAWVFAKPPTPGRVKTRLAEAVGHPAAASLYSAFVADVIDRVRSVSALRPRLAVDGQPDHPAIVALSCGLPRVAQIEGDLGRRMHEVLRQAVEAEGVGLVVGTDAPTLPAHYLEAAVTALESGDYDVVLGPAADGGYYLVAARDRVPDVFEHVRWSTSHTLRDTLVQAAAAQHRVHLLPPWYDVDTPQDLALLRLQLALRPAMAPATSHVLRCEPLTP